MRVVLLQARYKLYFMKNTLLSALAVALFLTPTVICAQAPSLGTAANFVLFSTNGAVTNSGNSLLTGNVGTNNGSNTGFGNVNGQMHSSDGVTAQAAADLLIAYNLLNATISTDAHAPLLGGGETLEAGIYAIGAAATLDGSLTFDAQNDPNAVFIVKIQGAFATTANSSIILTNGALACNIFWKVEGMVNMASGSTMRGTIIANNGAITMNTDDVLEGRAFSTTGAISVDGVKSSTPIGCGSAVLTGPVAPVLASTECFALFSGSGAVTNAGITIVKGDVGTNTGLTTGFQAENVTGTIHPNPDTATAQAAADLALVYTYLNTLPTDIELLYPAQFGNNLVLTPHTYLMNAATVFVGEVYLDAQGNNDAVFVIKINGALSTATFAKVNLINGTQSKNVYWKIDGAVGINSNSIIKGTLVGNNGAVDLATGVDLDGRAFSTTGTLTTNAVTAIMPLGCPNLGVGTIVKDNSVSIYPNPFTTSVTIMVNDAVELNKAQITLYDMLGRQVKTAAMTQQSTTISTDTLPSGVYFYKVIADGKIIQSGKLVSKQ